MSDERQSSKSGGTQRLSGGREPIGWKLVPIEPTQAMENSGFSYLGNWAGEGARASGVYRAMLSAAPIRRESKDE